MYTKLDDQRKANFIKNYISTHPNCTRKELMQETVITWTRLKYLEQEGYLKLKKYYDDKYTDEFINKINSFIQSDFYKSDFHLRKVFKMGYWTLQKLKTKGLIKYGFNTKGN